jgi:hypothetical protein
LRAARFGQPTGLAGPRWIARQQQAGFAKMAIEGEGTIDSLVRHYLKADAVRQAQFPPSRAETPGHPACKEILGHRMQNQEWQVIPMKNHHCLHPQARLEQTPQLLKNKVMEHDSGCGLKK